MPPAPTQTQNKFYKYTVNGKTYYDANPDLGNTPTGYTPIAFSEFQSGLQSSLATAKAAAAANPGNADYTKDASSYEALLSKYAGTDPNAQGAGQSGIVMVGNVPHPTADIAAKQKEEEGYANGTLVKSPIYKDGQVVGYAPVPAGSAAAANIQNLGTQNGETPLYGPFTNAYPAATPTMQNVYSKAAGYTGTSIVDFLTQAGQPADLPSRTALAGQLGIQGYTGTPAQNTQMLEILRSVASGKTNTLGVPSNMGQIGGSTGSVPSPYSPIPVSSLSNGSGNADLSKILGASANSGLGGDTTIAGLLSLLGATTDSEKEYDKIAAGLTDAMSKLGQEGADLQAAMDAQGVGAAYQQVKELNLKAAQMKGELDKFDAESHQGLSNIEGQAIPIGLIQGQQAEFQKQRDLTRLSKAAELSATIALSQAYQGNAQLGLELAQKSVDLKYQPIEAQINVLKTQLGIAGDKMSTKDSKNAAIIGKLIDIKQDEITAAKDRDKAVQNLAIQAAAGGAPTSVVSSMVQAGDPVKAAQLGATYLKGPTESVTKTGAGATSLTADEQKTGATRAGLSTAQFSGLPFDVQNFFANNATQYNVFKKSLDDITQGNSDVEDEIAEIKASGVMSEPVKAYLIQMLQTAASQKSGGGFIDSVKGAYNTVANGIKGLLGF